MFSCNIPDVNHVLLWISTLGSSFVAVELVFLGSDGEDGMK